jgi:hypothetical protein
MVTHVSRHVIQVSFPPAMTVEEIVDWLTDWAPAVVALHIPLPWRDVLSPHDWVLRTGQFPTYSVTGVGEAHTDDCVVVFRHRKETL